VNEKGVSAICSVDGLSEAERAIRRHACGQAHCVGGYRESVVLGKLRKQRQSAIQYALGLRPIVHGPHSREPQERRCAVWRRALFSLKHQRIEVGGHGKF